MFDFIFNIIIISALILQSMMEANRQYVPEVASASAMATVSATVTASASAAASASCAAVDFNNVNNNVNNNNVQGNLFYSTIANSCQK